MDFGASDMPLKSDELTSLDLGQFPIVIGGIVVAVNLDGVGPGGNLLLTDSPGDNAYPITATVFVLMHKSASQTRTRIALDFFRWSFEHGSNTAAELGYVPLPAALVQQVMSYWAATFKTGS